MRHLRNRAAQRLATVLPEVVVLDLQAAQRGAVAERLAEGQSAFFVRSRRGPAEGFDVREQSEQFADVLGASVATHIVVELDAFNVHGRRLADDVQKVLAGIHGHSVVVEQNHFQILLSLQMIILPIPNGDQLLARQNALRAESIVTEVQVLQLQVLQTIGKHLASKLSIIEGKAGKDIREIQILECLRLRQSR